MMATSTSTTMSSLERLFEYFNCPYREDLDGMTIDDMFNPGEGRSRVLQCLMSSFHVKLSELLDEGQLTPGSHAGYKDSRLQKLLTAAQAMLLCSNDDIELIQGSGSLDKQRIFVNQLICLCMQKIKAHACPKSDSSELIDSLIDSDLVTCFNSSWKPEPLPKDIQTELNRLQENDKLTGLPDLKLLMKQSDILSDEVDRCTKELESLQKTITLQSIDQRSETSTTSQILSTLVRELSMLVKGFSHCVEARLGMWCQRAPPQWSQLGPTLERVHSQLEFIKLFEDLNSVRTTQTKLQNDRTIQRAIGQEIGKSSDNASVKLQACLSILEESLHRKETSFVSRYSDVLAF